MAETLKLSRSSQLSVAIEVQCYLSDDDGVILRSDSLPVSQTSSNLDTAAGAAGAASGAYGSSINSICSLEDCSETVSTKRKWMTALNRFKSLQKQKSSNSSAPLQASNRDSSACSDASRLSSSLYKGQETTPKAVAARFRSSYAQSCSWAAGAARSLKHISRCLLSSCLTPKTKELEDYCSPQLLEDLQLKQQGPVQQEEPTTAAGHPINTEKGTAADPPSDAPLDTTAGSTIQAQHAIDVPEPESAAPSAPSVITPAAEAVAEESAPVISCAAAQSDCSISVEGRVASDDKVEVVDASYERAPQVCKACKLSVILYACQQVIGMLMVSICHWQHSFPHCLLSSQPTTV